MLRIPLLPRRRLQLERGVACGDPPHDAIWCAASAEGCLLSGDPNYFYEPFLRFAIRKPASWRFVPPAWSPVALLANNRENADEWPALAKHPFVCFMRDHTSQTEVYPTVQVTARRSVTPSSAQAEALVRQQIDIMAAHFFEYEPLDVSSTSIIAGQRAISIRSQYTLIAGEDDDEQSFAVCARSSIIFAHGFAFTIGMTSPVDPDYYDEDEFGAVLQSITIGRAPSEG